MNSVFKFSLYIILFFTGISYSSAQGSGVQYYADRIDSLHLKYPVEKVYLHTDKPYYSSGQDLWFRAYVTDGANRPSMLSKVLYVDLINSGNNIVRAMSLPLAAGLASGDLALPDTLPEGNYRLRAYTMWMRNFGEESFFERDLKINNPLADDVLADATFNYFTREEQEHVEVSIKYSTLEGGVFPARELAYEVSLGNQSVTRGKGLTDDQGRLVIEFINKDKSREAGLISTTFEHNERTVKKEIVIRGSSGDPDIKFFPEGGRLVDSIPSNVGFKAVGPDGLGIEVSGYVEDSRGARVAEFRAEHAGMGAFMLTPFTGQKYTAVFSYNGIEKRIVLPASSPEGYVMNLKGEDDKNFFFRITASKKLLANGEVKIAGRSSSGSHGITGFKMIRQFTDIALPKEGLPDGIVQLTLFSHDDRPVAERLVFVQPTGLLELDIQTGKREYKAREQVKMELLVKETDGEPVTGSFSIAVTDAGRLPVKDDKDHTILSELLLSSELKGHIEDPNYYFSGESKEKQAHLDKLLLTQGWRRISWKEDPPAMRFEAEDGISIKGQVMVKGAAVENGKVTLFSPDAMMSVDTLTDSSGRFKFDKLVFADSTRFVVQARTEKEKSNVQISLDVTAPQPVLTARRPEGISGISPAEEQEILKDSKDELRELMNQGLLKRTNMLPEVVVKAKTYSRTMKNSSKLGGAPADYVLTIDKIKDQPNLYHALSNKVPGVQTGIDPVTGVAWAKLFRNDQMLSGPKAMAIYLDGQFMGYDVNVIETSAVAFVEVIKNSAKTAIYGEKAFGGAIIVTTRIYAGIEDEPITQSPRGIITYKPKGYTVTREFYSPDYSVKQTKETRDLRSTIYWNPEVFTGKDKTAKFEFYTADHPGTYRAVVEGLDYKGRLGRKVVTFTVE